MERKSTLEALEHYTRANLRPIESSDQICVVEALAIVVCMHTREFCDANLNVLRSAFQAIGVLAECTTARFPKSVICLCVPPAIDKVGDRKASETVRTMLLSSCEATSGGVVHGICMECLFKQSIFNKDLVHGGYKILR